MSKTIDHKKKVANNFLCNCCTLVFEDDASLYEHVNVVHKKIAWRCDGCSKTVASDHLKTLHSTMHKEPVSFERVTMTTDSTLLKLKKKKRQQRYPCPQCESSFTELNRLTEHELNHQGLRWQCNNCHTFLNSRRNRSRHTSNHEGHDTFTAAIVPTIFNGKMEPEEPIQVAKELFFRCRHCSQTFRSPEKLDSHDSIEHHGLRWRCVVCSTVGSCEKEKEEHEKIHEQPPNFRAFIIPTQWNGQEVTDKIDSEADSSMKISQEEVPETETYHCLKCPQKFRNRLKLFEHETVDHGVRWKCNICGMTVRYKENKISHNRLHEGKTVTYTQLILDTTRNDSKNRALITRPDMEEQGCYVRIERLRDDYVRQLKTSTRVRLNAEDLYCLQDELIKKILANVWEPKASNGKRVRGVEDSDTLNIGSAVFKSGIGSCIISPKSARRAQNIKHTHLVINSDGIFNAASSGTTSIAKISVKSLTPLSPKDQRPCLVQLEHLNPDYVHQLKTSSRVQLKAEEKNWMQDQLFKEILSNIWEPKAEREEKCEEAEPEEEVDFSSCNDEYAAADFEVESFEIDEPFEGEPLEGDVPLCKDESAVGDFETRESFEIHESLEGEPLEGDFSSYKDKSSAVDIEIKEPFVIDEPTESTSSLHVPLVDVDTLSPTSVSQLNKIIDGCRLQMDMLVKRQDEMYRRLERRMSEKIEKQKIAHQRRLKVQRQILLKQRRRQKLRTSPPSIEDISMTLVSSTTPGTPTPPDSRPPSSISSISSVSSSKPTLSSPYKCCLCLKKFRDDEDKYRIHLLAHFDKVSTVCRLCEVDCGLNKFMKDHFMIAHGGLVKLVCDVNGCGRSFWTRRALDRHRVASHI